MPPMELVKAVSVYAADRGLPPMALVQVKRRGSTWRLLPTLGRRNGSPWRDASVRDVVREASHGVVARLLRASGSAPSGHAGGVSRHDSRSGSMRQDLSRKAL
jgi:hypothetical protein